MTGHHKFKELTENFSPERKARIEKQNIKLEREVTMYELHQQFLEKQTELYVNHLREVISAMGGELIIKASFPDREVVINSFSDLLENDSI
ncbi:MAG: transcriptional regulator [Cyanobacteriota bacterium]|nr:transcriptional regulator [Cyanobacteriota bacterium]